MRNIYHSLNLELRPETYKTLLKSEFGSNSETSKLRRKMSKATRRGEICYKPISSSNKGRDNIYYLIEKEYFIVFTKTGCFYCDNVEHKKNKIFLTNAYELNCSEWEPKKNIFLDIEEVVVCF